MFSCFRVFIRGTEISVVISGNWTSYRVKNKKQKTKNKNKNKKQKTKNKKQKTKNKKQKTKNKKQKTKNKNKAKIIKYIRQLAVITPYAQIRLDYKSYQTK